MECCQATFSCRVLSGLFCGVLSGYLSVQCFLAIVRSVESVLVIVLLSAFHFFCGVVSGLKTPLSA